MRDMPMPRRSFLARTGAALAALVATVPGPLTGEPVRQTGRADAAAGLAAALSVHPEPRPEVDGSSVLPAGDVPAHLSGLYDAVRAVPGVVDGIGCHCGCAEVPGMYSLLSCYGPSRMALHCDVCQGEGRLVVQLHGEGRTLDEIRAAVDRRFG